MKHFSHIKKCVRFFMFKYEHTFDFRSNINIRLVNIFVLFSSYLSLSLPLSLKNTRIYVYI